MNTYKLPVNVYNRTHEQTISKDAIKDKLVGQKKEEIQDTQKRKEFIQGYKCGTKSQFDADMKVFEQIRAEIEDIRDNGNLTKIPYFYVNRCLQIIDKCLEGFKEENDD